MVLTQAVAGRGESPAVLLENEVLEDGWEGFPAPWRQLLESFDGTRDCGEWLRTVRCRVREEEDAGRLVLPPKAVRFRALEMTDPEACKVVILGQDPYPTPGHATGMSFSADAGNTLPRSLANIFRELAADVGCKVPLDGDLSKWCAQGVLLLNTSLTVRAREPKSHHAMGWREVTDRIIKALAMSKRDGVFILWGNEAGRYAEMLEKMGQVVLQSSHPSPMGGSCFKGFYGSKPFSKANAELVRAGRLPVQWCLA